MRPLGLIFRNHLFDGFHQYVITSRAAWMERVVLFLLGVRAGGDIKAFGFIRQAKLLESDGGFDTIRRRPGV